MRSKVTITLSITYLFISLVWAQDISARTKDDIVLGINMTGTGYIGDLNYNANKGIEYFNVLPGFQATLRKDKNTFLSPAISLGYGRIVAQNPDLSRYVVFGPADNPDSYFEQPRFVRTDFVYGDVALRFTPIKNTNALFRPYVSAGLGGLLYFPLKNDSLSPKGLNLSRGESFSTTTTSIPLSVGTDLNLSRKVSINLGTNLRMPMNDYMDLYGAKLIPDRMKGNDLLVSFQVGANFRIFDAHKSLNPISLPPMQDALPEDTTLLASADPHAMPILLRPNADFMAVEEYSLLGSYPEGWVRLTVLAQSLECDSVAKLADQRISGLYNENLQLRSQYTKLQYQLDHPANIATPTENSAKVDSLMRVVYNKENKIRDLQEQLDAATPDQPTQSLGASTQIAEYEKQIIALNQQIAELKSGQTADNKSVGFTELEEKLKTIATEKEQLDADYAALKEQNTAIQQELATARRNPSADGGEPEILHARIDSLIQENMRVTTEMNEMRKNYLVLQQDYNDLKGTNSGELQNQLAALQAQNTEQANLITKLKTENEQLTSQNLVEIKNRLDQSNANVDSVDARYARLASAIEQYETALAIAKRQNDSLASEIQRLQAMVNVGGNPAAIDSVREASYVAEIEELRTTVATEQQVRKQAQDDVKIAGERNAALQDSLTKTQANIQDIAYGELAIARKRIEELEKTNAELLARSTIPTGDSLPENVVQNFQTQIESLKEDKDKLMSTNEEQRRTIEILKEGNTDAAVIADLQTQMDQAKRERDNFSAENENLRTKIAGLEAQTGTTPFATGIDSVKATELLGQVSTLTRERDSLSKVTIAFAEQEENGGGNEQVATLQKELQMAEAQRDELKGVMDKIDKNGFAPLKAELDKLKDENATLAARKNELEKELEVKAGVVSCEELATQVKELESQNTVMRQQIEKNVALQDQFITLQDELASKNIELDNEKMKNQAIAAKGNGDDSEKDNQILELTNANQALDAKAKEAEKMLSTTRDELAVMQARKVNEGTDGAANARVNDLVAQNQRLRDSIASMSMNPTPISSNPETESLLAQIEEEKQKNKDLQAKLDALPTDINPTLGAVNTTALTERITFLEGENQKLEADRNNLFEQLKVIGAGSPDATVTALTERLNLEQQNNAKLTADLEAARNTSGGTSNPSPDVLALQQQVESLTAEKNKLETDNVTLRQEIDAIKTGGDANAMIAELNTQVTQLTDENNALRKIMKTTAENGPTHDAELDEKLLTFQNQNAVLLEERDRYMNMYQELLAKNPGDGAVADRSNELAAKDEQIMQLNNQISALEVDVRKAQANPDVAVDNSQALNDANARIAELEVDLRKAQANPGVAVDNSQALNDANARIAELKTQLEKATSGLPTDIAAQLAEKDNQITSLNERLKEIESRPAPTTNVNADILAEKEATIADLRSQLAAAQTGDYAAIVADKDNQIKTLTQDVADAKNTAMSFVEIISQKDAEIVGLRAAKPNPSGDANAEVAVLMQEKLVLKKQVEDLTTQNQTLKAGNNNAEKVLELTDDLATVRERMQEQEAELQKLKDDAALPIDMKMATMQDQITQLEADKVNLNKTIADLNVQMSNTDQGPTIAALRGKISALEDEVRRLKEKTSIPQIDPTLSPATLQDEITLVRNQNQELFTENENLRTALANALEELQRVRVSNSGTSTSDNSEALTLKADNEKLMQEKAGLESKIVGMQAIIDNATNGSGDKEMLVTQNSRLLEDNQALKERMSSLERDLAEAKIHSNPVVDNTEIELLRTQNSDLNGKVMSLEAEVNRLNAVVAAGLTPANGGTQVESLLAQVATLKDQLEKNTTYVDNAIAQHDADMKRINQLEADLRNISGTSTNPIATVPSTEKDEEIARLNDRVNQLVADNDILNRKVQNAGFAAQPGATSGVDSDLSRRIAELAARERRIVQREAYIETKEEEISLAEDRSKGVKALEVELRMLEQTLKGFMNSNGEVMQDGSPCFPVSAAATKDEVMNRINDYFVSTANAKYEIVNGMMVYRNVMIPEIDKNKPMNVAFYMTISSEDASKRIFQGAFQYVGDKTYITSEKYPAQSFRVLKLLQKLSQ